MRSNVADERSANADAAAPASPARRLSAPAGRARVTGVSCASSRSTYANTPASVPASEARKYLPPLSSATVRSVASSKA